VRDLRAFASPPGAAGPVSSAAYNQPMQHPHRSFFLAALVTLGAAPVGAQTSLSNNAQTGSATATPAGAQPAAKPAGRPDRAIERIRTEDAGARIDEVRVGGETQSITVQPAADVPAYEVKPKDAARGTSGSAADTGTGSRFWNVLKF